MEAGHSRLQCLICIHECVLIPEKVIHFKDCLKSLLVAFLHLSMECGSVLDRHVNQFSTVPQTAYDVTYPTFYWAKTSCIFFCIKCSKDLRSIIPVLFFLFLQTSCGTSATAAATKKALNFLERQSILVLWLFDLWRMLYLFWHAYYCKRKMVKTRASNYGWLPIRYPLGLVGYTVNK